MSMGALEGRGNALLEAALAMAARGFRVFPLVPNSKKPAIKEWQKRATTDEATIREWWALRPFNIGIATGQGLVGIDLDVKEISDGRAVFQSWGYELADLASFVVRTPSGGYHVYYEGDARNSASSLGAGVDVRGEGGYLVGPGSRIGAATYEIVCGSAPGLLPAGLVQRIAAARPRPDLKIVETIELDLPGSIASAAEWLKTAPPAVWNDGGDEHTFRIAAKLKDFGVAEETAFRLLQEHWNERCLPNPWPLDMLQVKVANAYQYGALTPGVSSPERIFAGISIIDESAPPLRPVDNWFNHGDPWDRDQSWLFHELLPAQGVAVLVGPPQCGKTFVVLEAGRCLGTGKSLFDRKPEDIGGTLFCFAGSEGSGLARRMAALGEEERLPMAATIVGDLSAPGALDSLLQRLEEKCAAMKEEFGVPVRMVVLETLAASGLFKDENDAGEVSRALANLAQIGHRLGVLILTSHHPGKDGKTRGSSAIEASADYLVRIWREGTAQLRLVELAKARDAEQRHLGSFTLQPVDLGVDSRGRPVTSMSVSMGAARPPPTQLEGKHAHTALQALEFAGVEQASESEGVEFVAYDTVVASFLDLCTLGANANNRRAELDKALHALEQQGLVESRGYVGDKHYRLKETIQ